MLKTKLGKFYTTYKKRVNEQDTSPDNIANELDKSVDKLFKYGTKKWKNKLSEL